MQQVTTGTRGDKSKVDCAPGRSCHMVCFDEPGTGKASSSESLLPLFYGRGRFAARYSHYVREFLSFYILHCIAIENSGYMDTLKLFFSGLRHLYTQDLEENSTHSPGPAGEGGSHQEEQECVLERMKLIIAGLVEGAQVVREIATPVKAGEVGDFVLNAWLGALKRADMTGCSIPLEYFENTLLDIFPAAGHSESMALRRADKSRNTE